MKNLGKALILGVCCLASSYGFAQVKVEADNKVRIGPGALSGGTFAEDVRIYGSTYIQCSPASSGFYFTNAISGLANPGMLPQWPNTALVGTAAKPLWSVEAYELNCVNLYQTSDRRLKTNIRSISPSMVSNVYNLSVYKYDMKSDVDAANPNKTQIEARSKNKVGFMAQEVQQLFPEFVKQREGTEYLAVDYVSLIPLMVEAMKMQKQEIENLKREIEALR